MGLNGHEKSATIRTTQPVRRTEIKVDGDIAFEVFTAESKNQSARRFLVLDERSGFKSAYGRSDGGRSKTQWIAEVRQSQVHNRTVDAVQRRVETTGATELAPSSLHRLRRDRRPSSQSSLWLSMQSPPIHGPSDYYPLRPISAGEAVAVSLISPRMLKRIRRLPRPEASELEKLQVLRA